MIYSLNKSIKSNLRRVVLLPAKSGDVCILSCIGGDTVLRTAGLIEVIWDVVFYNTVKFKLIYCNKCKL